MKRMHVLLIICVALSLLLPLPCLAGGHLKIALTGNLNTLDPAKAKSGDEYIYMFLVFSGLTVIDRDMTTKPDLAYKWESSQDLKTWTFYLRQGVKFHHGREMTAEDVSFTINRIMDKATGSKARVNFLMVEKIEVIDKYTVRFHLNIPYAGFPDIFGGRQVRWHQDRGTALPRPQFDQLLGPIGRALEAVRAQGVVPGIFARESVGWFPEPVSRRFAEQRRVRPTRAAARPSGSV